MFSESCLLRVLFLAHQKTKLAVSYAAYQGSRDGKTQNSNQSTYKISTLKSNFSFAMISLFNLSPSWNPDSFFSSRRSHLGITMEGNCQSSCQSSFNNYVHLVYILIKFPSCTYHVYCRSTEFKPKSKVLLVISIVSVFRQNRDKFQCSFACSSWSIVTESKVSLQIYFSWSLECLQNVISTILHVGTSWLP